MNKNPANTEFDPDDDIVEPKSQRRPLNRGETVPHIPTLIEQLDMVWAASAKIKPRSR